MHRRSLLPIKGVITCTAALLVASQVGGAETPANSTTAAANNNAAVAPWPVGLNFNESKELLQVLQLRKEQQVQAAAPYKIFHDFTFSDRYHDSGIQFSNRAVEDAGKYFKPAHYDHGTGLAAADVDNDGLPDLYFVNQVGGNELWRNRGNGQFENITDKAGVGLKDRVSVTASFADVDNDGDPDLFVSTVRMGNTLFENIGQGKFRDVSEAAGVNYFGHSSGAVFFDFNNDGLLDLFVCNIGRYTNDERGKGGYYRALPDAFAGQTKPDRSEQSLLYQNLGGLKFKEVSAAMNLVHHGWSGDATFCDINGDRFPDLYVLSMQGDDQFYLNIDGKRFEESTAKYFPKTPWGAMGIKFFDFNQDGQFDLFVTDMHSDMTGAQTRITKVNFNVKMERAKSEPWCSTEWTQDYLKDSSNNLFGNAFYLNAGPEKYVEVSDKVHSETLWPWGVSVGDVNADGFEDAFVTAGMGLGFRYGINSLLLSESGKQFVHSEFLVGIEPRYQGRTHKVAFVLDCGGADKNHPNCRGRSESIPVIEPVSSRSSVLADLDNDGDLDIVANEMNDRPQILLSNLSQRKPISYIAVKLKGITSNSDGLGSIIRVRSGGRTYTQQHDGKSGYLAQSSLPLYFGLGESKSVESVEVHWPSGRKQIVQAPAANKTLIITEPANP